ncbi:Serine/threonine-protein kinase [Acorus calamus]|uniref:Serine/threonine-protein kinase n=1 Tax=Acorus calamus TaxID=4465 RepID=A0AAV9C4V1_ACOCL|nr:Serine/threonine-protein kinase [Acorus calamus]
METFAISWTQRLFQSLRSSRLKLRGCKQQKQLDTLVKDPVGTPAVLSFHELASATKNFCPELLLNEGSSGRLYKGILKSSGQIVAIKQFNDAVDGTRRMFLVETLMMSLLHHPNLIRLLGYCTEEGVNENHLQWCTRMKIAAEVAKCLEYLQTKASPLVIHRNLKPSNILLDAEFNPKVSGFGLAKLGPTGDRSHVSTRMIGIPGYIAPEFMNSGQLTVKCDIYSFGVILLELITGRRAIDVTRPSEEHSLVTWAKPKFEELERFVEMADPLLQGQYPVNGLNRAMLVAAKCLEDESLKRPPIGDLVTMLTSIVEVPTDIK